jgi:uncharacterized membrane protein YphA (DoxX/SURF4 family)/mono/diheme cytochrome c family protein
MPATLAERFVFGTADPKPVTSVHIVPRVTTALIGRLALAAIFMVAGFEKLADTSNTTAHMNAAGLPAAGVLVYVAAFVEIFGAVSLALGAFARVGAVMLTGYLLVVTFVFHAFWNYQDAERGRQLVNFLKNLAIAGGLLMIVAHGPGRSSVDARLRSSLVTFVMAVLALVGCRRDAGPMPAAPVQETATPAPVLDPTHVARGAYVVALAGCKICHTAVKDGAADHARAFAGGLEVKMPDGGVWRTPNITPDRVTGIGTWSDTEIITAMRRGIRRDGSKLVPIMPYPYFHRMSDSDARSVVMYLRSLRPITSVVERSELLSMAPIDLPEPVDNVDPIDDARGHGEYLANLMHCGGCHTPRTGSQANQLFAGGVVLPVSPTQSVTSANITSDPDTGIGTWTESEIITAVRTGKTPDGHEIVGPMGAYVDGWSKLDERDAQALAEYIKSVAPVRSEIPEHRTAH